MTHPNPIFSVVVPAYNQAQFLRYTIDSILAQTVKEFEIIVVDDGSTDNTAEVAASYGDKIRYVYQENMGLAGVRNTGVREARGNFVSFLDSDDMWAPNYLEKIRELAERHPDAGLFCAGVTYMNAKGEPLSRGYVPLVEPEKMYAKILRGNFLYSIVTIRIGVARENLSDVKFRRLQDWELWIRLLKKGVRFVGTDESLAFYRMHSANSTKHVANGQAAALAIAAKHFGPDDGRYDQWEPDKRRMYGGAYIYCGVTASLIQASDWDDCVEFVGKALLADPELAKDVDMFYELALGAQPMGERGAHQIKDLAAADARLREAVAKITSGRFDPSLKKTIEGTSAYALGLLAYSHKQFRFSRKQFFTTIKNRSDLNFDRKLMSHFAKSALLTLFPRLNSA